MPWCLLRRWLTEATLALKYLHDKHVLHRDLKSQNLFLTAKELRSLCVIWCYGFENWLESVSLNAHVKRKGLTWLSTRRFSTTNTLTFRSLTSDIWKSAPFINVIVLVSSRFIVQDRLRIGDFGISKARCDLGFVEIQKGMDALLPCHVAHFLNC